MAGSRWYVGEATNGETCLFVVTSSTGGSCLKPSPKFESLTSAVPIGPREQLTAVLLPDAYTRIRVVGGAARQLLQPRSNVAFVRHDQRLEIEASGADGLRQRIAVRYVGPFGTQ